MLYKVSRYRDIFRGSLTGVVFFSLDYTTNMQHNTVLHEKCPRHDRHATYSRRCGRHVHPASAAPIQITKLVPTLTLSLTPKPWVRVAISILGQSFLSACSNVELSNNVTIVNVLYRCGCIVGNITAHSMVECIFSGTSIVIVDISCKL